MDSDPAFRRVLIGILLAIGLGAVDQSIVGPALPTIARELDGITFLSWTVAAYLLTSTIGTLIFGKLSDLYGRRPLMLISIVGFGVASVACALAANLLELTTARAVQGLFGGGLIVLAQAMLADFVTPRERGRYQGPIASVWAAAYVAGPPLGGFFVDHLSWRWAFWVNIPLAIYTYWIFSRAPVVHTGHTQRRIDYGGIALFTVTSTAWLLLASTAGVTYPWVSTQTLGLAALAAVSLAAFIAIERRVAEPVLPLRLYANPTIRLTNVEGFVVSVLLVAGGVLFPVFLQLVLRLSAGASGVAVIPFMIGTSLTSWIFGDLMRKTGSYKWMMPTGFCVTALGYALLVTAGPDSAAWLVAAKGSFIGLGIGMCFPVLNVIIVNACEPRDIGVAISTISFARTIGGAFGAAIFWSLLVSLAHGVQRGDALTSAFHVDFIVAAALGVAAGGLALALPEEPLLESYSRERAPARTPQEAEPT